MAMRAEDTSRLPQEPVKSRISFAQAIGIPLNVLCFLLLMVMAWGSWSGFFAHPKRVGVVVLHLVMIPVMTLSTSGRIKGRNHSSVCKLFFPLFIFLSLFTAWEMPYMDARDQWVLPGGDVTLWI